jgi:predicted nucleotidyltransferase
MHSTVIRKSIAEGRSDDIKDLLPECILKEILNNNYYK